jgi:UTP--glucose-1-phosphate uridylyltransferase
VKLTSSKIRKAVIPAAGLGTRFLPATKVIPKELLPIAGRPLIQHAVEEAVASGVEIIILVVGPGKDLLTQHFQRSESLENVLLRRGQSQDAADLRRLAELAEIRTVWQEQPIGLANAITTAKPLIDDEPFAVILPDALIDAKVPCIRQLMECYEKHPGCIVATREVRADEVERFGVVDVARLPSSDIDNRVLQVISLIERPEPGQTTSHWGIFGRYILTPEIFSCSSKTRVGRGGEFQLTDSLALCAERSPIYAYRFEGEHYDAGNKLGFIQATIAYGLKDAELSIPLAQYLAELNSALTPVVQ